MVEAVRNFFSIGHLLGEVNTTMIILVLKVPHPESLTQFKPISCSNVVYKIISKILANRLKTVLPGLVDEPQTAFVPGRSICDNILLAQELVYQYHLHKGQLRCAMKVDFSSAYDSVE